MTIQDILKSLPRSERDQLMYAFENSLSCIVKYRFGLFVAVNMIADDSYDIEQKAGVWCAGKLKKSV